MIIFRLLSVELLVLIAAIFLLVYITKSQVSKWFTYSTALIIVVVILMMVCTVCCTMCMRHCGMEGGMRKECRMEMQMGGPEGMMMEHRMHGGCEHEGMGEGECENEMKECEMHEGGEGKQCCKKGMHEEKCMEKEMNEGKDSVKKVVIIKKK